VPVPAACRGEPGAGGNRVVSVQGGADDAAWSTIRGMSILKPVFQSDRDGDIRQEQVCGFVRSPQGGVVVQLHDGKPDRTVPNVQWDGFCEDAIAAINRRELERRDREAKS